MSLLTARVEVGTPDMYHDAVMADEPVGFWPLHEMFTLTNARDSSGGGNDGDYVGVGTGIHAPGVFPHGGTSVQFDGVDALVNVGDIATFEFTGAMTAEFLFKTTGLVAGISGLVGKALSATGAGWQVFIQANGTLRFSIVTGAGVTIFNVITAARYDDHQWHHVVCTWDGTTTANKAQMYVDGVVVAQATAGAGTPGTNAARLLFAARDNAGTAVNFLSGFMTGVALYNKELSASTAAAHYATTQWTNITDDVDGDAGGKWSYGLRGNTPLERGPSPGQATFTLFNDAEGYYAPHHPDHWVNFQRNIPVRIVEVDDGAVEHVRFWGRLVTIDPVPGAYRVRKSKCIAHDYVWLLLENSVRFITVQANQTEDNLFLRVLEALPVSVQPMAVDLDAGVDTFDVAFSELKDGAPAITVCTKIAKNAHGKWAVTGDGTFRYRNRVTEVAEPAAYEFTDSEYVDVKVPASLAKMYNRVRITIHPKEFGATDTEVLYATTSVISIAAGETINLEFQYSDPNNRNQKIGAMDFQDPLVENTDYDANTAADGSGSDISTDIDIVAEFWGSLVKLAITNNNGATAYLVTSAGVPKLQVRARGIYDRSPIIIEASSGKGDRPIDLDLEYQSDPNTALALAQLILAQYEAFEQQVDAVIFDPDASDELADEAMSREPLDVVTVIEDTTGINVHAVVHSMQHQLSGNFKMRAQFNVSTKLVSQPFILDDADFGQLDENVLGYG